MMLLLLLIVPFSGGFLALAAQRLGKSAPRIISLAILLVELTLACSLLFSGNHPIRTSFTHAWVPRLGISFHLALDGLSLILIILTAGIGIAAIASSWSASPHRPGFFHGNVLWTIAGIIGVFLAFDLFLFYLLWELMLIPMYFIILLWGDGSSRAAGIKFIIFTQVSGLFMLLGILVLYFHAGMASGVYSFDYDRLVIHARPAGVLWWAMIGFFIACAVKLGIVPFHAWLPDAYCASPPAGGILLGGVMSKTGAYALLRFMAPLFPVESLSFSRIAMVLGVVSIIYGAAIAIAQTDLKRLIAYSSISHMGFVLLAIGAWNRLALQGAIVQIVSHAVIITALFILADCLEKRLHTTDMERMGGLWEGAPRMGFAMLLFALASMGLPGLGSFIGEFLILLGSFRHSAVITVVAAASGILSVIYALSMMNKVFQGPLSHGRAIPDLSLREAAIVGLLSAVIIGAGLYPQPIVATGAAALETLERAAEPLSTDPPLDGARP
jgi:NADH-quinone oxidoreductase subunit M